MVGKEGRTTLLLGRGTSENTFNLIALCYTKIHENGIDLYIFL